MISKLTLLTIGLMPLLAMAQSSPTGFNSSGGKPALSQVPVKASPGFNGVETKPGLKQIQTQATSKGNQANESNSLQDSSIDVATKLTEVIVAKRDYDNPSSSTKVNYGEPKGDTLNGTAKEEPKSSFKNMSIGEKEEYLNDHGIILVPHK